MYSIQITVPMLLNVSNINIMMDTRAWSEKGVTTAAVDS